MGYILPINQYGYKDYLIRTIKEKQDPFYIEKLYKITPVKFGQLVKDQMKNDHATFKNDQVVFKKRIQDLADAKQEGKGTLFNTRI